MSDKIRLLNSNFEFCGFDKDTTPPYAILLHTWSENNEEEVTYQDLEHGTTKPKLKLELCRDWVSAVGYEYFWIDTCCIDKQNDAELKYSIRSMWKWYEEASVCFVYLPDLSKKRQRDTDVDWRDGLKSCRWFTRGWTLQELVASKRIEFYARDGHLSSMEDLLPALKSITGIELGNPLPDHATRLSWVAERVTQRPEDKAYCMLGICEVVFDPLYGEGPVSAWRRLQDAITQRHGTIALEFRKAETKKDRRKRMLKTLRFDGPETRRETVEVAIANTCEWILDHPACAKWLKLEHKFFWIKGKPGAGKSVLIRYLDHHITQRLRKSDAIGLYFYFNARGWQLEKSFLGLYRSLLVQLVDLVPKLVHMLDALDTSFDLLQRKRVLTSAISGLDRHIWLFIDALDECREGDVRELIEFLDGLQNAKLYVCFASRHYPIFNVLTDLQLVLEDLDEHKQDLSTYVKKLDLEGEELAQMQRDTVAKANGIFLWVVLVVGILQKDVERARFHAMQSRLREIPEGLLELFKSIILRDAEHKEEFLLCLRWILYSWRPLTLKEWYFAMMAGVDGYLEWMEGVTDTRMKTFLMSSSKGLAESITGWEGTPQFIHESVREYLIDQGGLEEICGDHESLTSIAHEQLKHCCLRGMAFDMSEHFKQRCSQEELYTEDQRYSLRARYPFAEYATTYVLHHANQAAVEVCQQHFRAHEIRNSKWTRRFNFFQKSKLSVYSGSPSLRYLCAERNLARLMARPANALSLDEQQRYGTPLIAAIVHSSWEVLRLFLTDMGVPDVDQTVAEVESKSKFVLLPRSLLSIPWRWAIINDLEHLSRHILTFVSEKHSDEALRIASYGGHEKVVQMLIERGSDVKGAPLLKALEGGHTNIAQILIDAGAGTSANDAALLKALEGGYEGIAQMLIDAGAGFDDAVLLKAIKRGYVKVVQMLIDGGADVKGAPLLEALELGHEDIAQMLIDAGAGANDIALLKASERGYGKLVKMLIDTGADVNTRGESHITALHAAFANGHEKVMRTLIDAGAGVNQEGEDYRSVLQEASRIGHEKVVQMLIDAGADVNQGEDCRSALQEALEGGHGKVVQVLIDAGADANARGKGGASALHTASLGGHEQIVRILIDAGADVDAQEGGRLGSALKAASGSGYEGVVKMLIDAGADVNAQGGGRLGSALQAASGTGRQRVVKMLIDAGANVDAQGGRYGNALQAAISGVRGEENVKGIVEMLIDAGADVNALGLDFTGSYSTALQSASDRGYGKVVQILKNAGAAGRSD